MTSQLLLWLLLAGSMGKLVSAANAAPHALKQIVLVGLPESLVAVPPPAAAVADAATAAYFRGAMP